MRAQSKYYGARAGKLRQTPNASMTAGEIFLRNHLAAASAFAESFRNGPFSASGSGPNENHGTGAFIQSLSLWREHFDLNRVHAESGTQITQPSLGLGLPPKRWPPARRFVESKTQNPSHLTGGTSTVLAEKR
jgi:hypothetical protein